MELTGTNSFYLRAAFDLFKETRKLLEGDINKKSPCPSAEGSEQLSNSVDGI
jgi:hypothetical protein